MLTSTASAPRVTRCSLGKYWSRDFFQKKAGWLTDWLGDVILSRSDRLPRRWGSAGSQAGVHRLSMTQWEAAKFDDACPVPTPCLLLSGFHTLCRGESWQATGM